MEELEKRAGQEAGRRTVTLEKHKKANITKGMGPKLTKEKRGGADRRRWTEAREGNMAMGQELRI